MPNEDEGRASRYNEVFEFYVEPSAEAEEIDLIGLIAYALYKRQKRDWLMSYAERHGRAPSASELAGLTGGYLTSDARRTYRDRAANLLDGYAAVYIDAQTPSIRETALNNEALRRAEATHAAIVARTGFWSSVWSGIVSTGLWTLLVAVVLAALRPDVFRTLADLISPP